MWGLSDEEVAARRGERLSDEWNGVRRWFRGGAGEAPPWHELDRALGDAIEWIIQSAQRLIDRRTRRVDRAAEYRSLALLFDRAETAADCHALFAAVFGLYQPRHFSVPEADPELSPSTASWWDAEPAPVEATLYRPGARAPGAGRASDLPDHSMARQALAARRERERYELAGRSGASPAPGRCGSISSVASTRSSSATCCAGSPARWTPPPPPTAPGGPSPRTGSSGSICAHRRRVAISSRSPLPRARSPLPTTRSR